MDSGDLEVGEQNSVIMNPRDMERQSLHLRVSRHTWQVTGDVQARRDIVIVNTLGLIQVERIHTPVVVKK